MKRLFFLLLFFVVAFPAFAQGPQEPVPGWRFPDQQDFYGNWELYRKMIPVPYHVRADFNGDGLPDDAWILLKTDGPGWGLFVFLGQPGGQPDIIQLAESTADDAQSRALQVAPPGHYLIIDEFGKKKDVILTMPALNLFIYAGPNLFFYWDAATGGFRKGRALALPKT